MPQKHLEIFLYFLTNAVLIMLGIILIQLNIWEAIGGSLAAAGIAGIVMYWALYVNKARSEKDVKRLEIINRFGILEILPRRLVKEEGDALGNKGFFDSSRGDPNML